MSGWCWPVEGGGFSLIFPGLMQPLFQFGDFFFGILYIGQEMGWGIEIAEPGSLDFQHFQPPFNLFQLYP
jgi:hypothetical protein